MWRLGAGWAGGLAEGVRSAQTARGPNEGAACPLNKFRLLVEEAIDLHDLHPGLSSADLESILMLHEAKRSKQLRVEQAVLCSAVMLLGVCRNFHSQPPIWRCAYEARQQF